MPGSHHLLCAFYNHCLVQFLFLCVILHNNLFLTLAGQDPLFLCVFFLNPVFYTLYADHQQNIKVVQLQAGACTVSGTGLGMRSLKPVSPLHETIKKRLSLGGLPGTVYSDFLLWRNERGFCNALRVHFTAEIRRHI